jgi:hypothetical protein
VGAGQVLSRIALHSLYSLSLFLYHHFHTQQEDNRRVASGASRQVRVVEWENRPSLLAKLNPHRVWEFFARLSYTKDISLLAWNPKINYRVQM